MKRIANRILRNPISVLLALLLAACADDTSTAYRGALYFGQGGYVMRISLHNGSLSVAGHLGDTNIRDLSPFGENHLLVSGLTTVNRARVSRISWFNLRTAERGDMYAGVRARYLATGDVLIYDDGSALFAVPQQDRSTNELIFPHPQSRITAMVGGAAGVLLLETLESGRPMIHVWDADTRKLQALEGLTTTCRLEGAVWVDPLARLACIPRDGAAAATGYLLSDLDGDAAPMPGLPTDRAFRALAYVSDQRLLVMQETGQGWIGQGEQHSVWIYAIDNWERQRLADDVYLGSTAVYAQH